MHARAQHLACAAASAALPQHPPLIGDASHLGIYICMRLRCTAVRRPKACSVIITPQLAVRASQTPLLHLAYTASLVSSAALGSPDVLCNHSSMHARMNVVCQLKYVAALSSSAGPGRASAKGLLVRLLMCTRTCIHTCITV